MQGFLTLHTGVSIVTTLRIKSLAVIKSNMAKAVIFLICAREVHALNLNQHTDVLSDVFVLSSGKNADSFQVFFF